MSLLARALKSVGQVSTRDRKRLADEARAIIAKIDALGVPRMWGTATEEILADVQRFQQECAALGVSAPAAYHDYKSDVEHISASDVRLSLEEIIQGLDPTPSMGG